MEHILILKILGDDHESDWVRLDLDLRQKMDSSKINEGSEECSSSESGWTMYIASPDTEHNRSGNEDDVDDDVDRRGYKKDDVAEDVDSDDSMASDASSGPSDQRCLYGHVGRNEKKDNKKEQKKKHHQQIKVEKTEQRAKSAGKFKKI
ncbi:hypothetical protein DH2020_032495 [Rehmannia glutinosa]|uniref:Uncharacterized protein n=1 Tax=Rehmannia glutinosa TaxID=99300 RepID=A0ABR0VI65_REHGL